MIVGLGVDACDVGRIRAALEGPAGSRFAARVFTPEERAYCEARRRRRFESYAARFAAKEAVMKAIGTGWGSGVRWRDIEVVVVPRRPPALALRGAVAALARRRGVARWFLSLTHTDTVAVACVVAETDVTSGAEAGSGRRRPTDRR